MYSTAAVIDIFGVFSASMVRNFPFDVITFVEMPRSPTATTESRPSLRPPRIHFISVGHCMRVRCWRVVFCVLCTLLSTYSDFVSSKLLTPFYPGRSHPPVCRSMYQRQTKVQIHVCQYKPSLVP
jgi:hypothetical protein